MSATSVSVGEPSAAVVPANGTQRAGDAEAKRLGFRLTLPAQVLVLFIAVFPLLMQLYISLTDWSPLSGVQWWNAWTQWNGFANYSDLVADGRFWSALKRTAIVMLVCVPVEFLLGLVLAMLFADEFPGKRIFYSILLMPMMVVPAVAGYMFFMLFQSGGPVNDVLSTLTGLPISVAWLSDPTLALLAVMAADIWQWTPLMFLILLAGLVGVPEDQIKAATLLGANAWQRFTTIVLPKMKVIIIIALAIRVIENFKIFDTLYIMTGGGPGVATETISVYIYKITTQDLIWGYVAAIALAILVLLSIAAVFGMKQMAKAKRGGASAIHLQGLVKKFGDFTALKTMDLEIADGEFMALLGPSGCGKTTTMNMIAGMVEPTDGRILFGNRDMAGVPMGRRGVGFVFQNYAIFTHMTVRENLAYGPRVGGATKDEIARRTRAIADLLELTPLLDRKADRLSVNILQRVAIGRSAIMEPAIFLLDEPLSNVDAAFRAVMRTELKHLQRQFKQTMVYVTHDQLEAMTMADRIAVMDHGVLQQVGTPLEVYNNPANVFVARFIGAPGMNLLKGQPAAGDRGLVVDLGSLGASPPLPADLAAAVGRRDRPVYYGFRPEQTLLGKVGPGIAMPVTFVERIGARTIIHLGEGAQAVKAVCGNDARWATGETAVVAPVETSVRVFDGATGLAITAG